MLSVCPCDGLASRAGCNPRLGLSGIDDGRTVIFVPLYRP